MNETLANVVSPHMSMKVATMAKIAITIGTMAMKDANTNASTISAPRPPIIASISTPGPFPPLAESFSAS